jgi:phosphoserine phosphatase
VTPQPPFRVVILDCDSTLTRIEGIDELARLHGVEGEIAELTAAAMRGDVPIESIYGRRLEMIRPRRKDLEWLASRYTETLVEGASDLVRILQALRKNVHIVSGGLLHPVAKVAAALSIPAANVHAVNLVFGDDGSYAGFVADSPLTRSGGKGDICAALIRVYGNAAAVGDGITDLEMQAAGARMIGFGGVAVRPIVRQRADVFVEAPSLLAVLPHLLTAGEIAEAGLDSTVQRAHTSSA